MSTPPAVTTWPAPLRRAWRYAAADARARWRLKPHQAGRLAAVTIAEATGRPEHFLFVGGIVNTPRPPRPAPRDDSLDLSVVELFSRYVDATHRRDWRAQAQLKRQLLKRRFSVSYLSGVR
jgi:hypothetical protein